MTCDWWTLGVLIFEFLSGSPPFYDESQYKVYERILTAKIEWPRYFDSTAKDIIKKLLNIDPTKRLGSGNCGLVNKSNKLKSDPAAKLSIDSTESTITESTLTLANTSTLSSSIFLTQTVEQILEKEKESSANKTKENSLSIQKSSQSNSLSLGASSSTQHLQQSTSQQQAINQIQKTKNLTGSEEVKNHRWFISIVNWTDVYERRLKPPFKPEVLHEGDTRNFEKYETPDLSKAPIATEKQLNVFCNF